MEDWIKETLKKMQVKSYPSLYKTSNSCTLHLENNILKIYPEKYYNPKKPSQGLDYVEEDMVEMEYSIDKEREITLKILEILEKDYKNI